MSVAGASRQSVRLTAERRSDGQVLVVGPWVRGRLLLFDLGYYAFSLFERIERHGGYFVSRLKQGANPRIVGVNRGTPTVVGERLQDVLPTLRREVLDATVEVEVPHRPYRGRRRTVRKRLRLVGVKDAASGAYHCYLTNIAPEDLAPEHIAQCYALRWEVELLFRELKTHYRLEDLPSRKPEVVKALVYAAALTLLVSRRLLHALRQALGRRAERLKAHRWAAILADVAADLLLLLLNPPRETRALQIKLNRLLLHEAPDPNATRPSLLQAVEAGIHRYRRTPRPCTA
jgi:IS4 transposase